jgi:hypothetical protein
MTTQETGTPTTVTECQHGLKKFAKKYQGINFVVQQENAWEYWTAVKTHYVTPEQLQGLWEWYQASERARATLRDLSQEPS